MSIARHEPIPLPPQGGLETVHESSDTIFNWNYEVGRESLLNLYEKGKRMQWNASTDIDWSIDVDRSLRHTRRTGVPRPPTDVSNACDGC